MVNELEKEKFSEKKWKIVTSVKEKENSSFYGGNHKK